MPLLTQDVAAPLASPDSELQRPGAKQHRADIDGLRALAVLSVLGFHTGTPGFSGGYVGVDVFFVISGFLICSIIVRELDAGTFSIARFYERRCKRILPALFVVLAFCLLAALFLLSPSEAAHLGKNIVGTAFSMSNFQFYVQGSYFDHGGILNPLLMTWSLAVEEQFYLVFPLLMLLLYKRNRKHLFATLAVGCTLSLLLSIFCEFRHPEFNFYLPFTRAWEIGAGTLLALWQAHSGRSQALSTWRPNLLGSGGLLMVLGCTVRYSAGTRFPGYEALVPVAGTLLLLISPGGIANRFLSLKPFVAVGLISYSLYLWHWPLLSFAAIVTSNETPARARAALMLFAVAAATLSYYWIESPFRKARNLSARLTLLAYGTAIGCVALLGLTLKRTNGLSVRSPQLARTEDSLGMDRSSPCLGSADRGPNLISACVPPPTAAKAVALLGDSHAGAISETLGKQVAAAGGQLLTLTAFSCPPLHGFTRSLTDVPQHAAACARFNEQALDLVTARPDVKTVVLSGSWAMVPGDIFVPDNGPARNSSENNLVQGLTAEIKAFEAAHKQVILLDDWPSLPFVPLDRVKYTQLPMRRLVASVLTGGNASGLRINTILRADTITPNAEAVRRDLLALTRTDHALLLIDSKQSLCTATTCTFGEGPNLFYVDNNHVSRFGAERILANLNLR